MLVAPVTVGDGVVTAAGSVVIEDIPPNKLVAGVPAKIKKDLSNDETKTGESKTAVAHYFVEVRRIDLRKRFGG